MGWVITMQSNAFVSSCAKKLYLMVIVQLKTLPSVVDLLKE